MEPVTGYELLQNVRADDTLKSEIHPVHHDHG